MTTVMCAGTFDVIHKGHLHYLTESKKYGDKLIVVVARDSTSEKIKGRKPLHNEQQRLNQIKKLKIADNVILGKEGNIFDIIEEIKPDIICLGHDQKVKENDLKKELEKRGINAKIVRISAYMPDVYKSSKISL